MMKIAVPDIISNSYFPAAAAVELGFFKQEGLDVSLELLFPVDQAYAALRDGVVYFIGGSAHSALAAFPEWRGVKLLCAQAQGMYWFLVMDKKLGAKRGDGPKPAFNYTMASIATTDRRIAHAPETAAAAIRAIVKTQAALRQNVASATEVGRKLFPPSEAELIAELIRRDLPYYDPTISEAFVAGMNQFARDIGILEGHVPYSQVVATQFCPLWLQ